MEDSQTRIKEAKNLPNWKKPYNMQSCHYSV